MKKIILIFVLALIVMFAVNEVKAQSLLYCETYSTTTRDSVTIAGSTDAGSQWFTNAGYEQVWFAIYDGALWWTFKIDYPCRRVQKFMIQMEGGDTTLRAVGYLRGGESVQLPIVYQTASTWQTYKLDFSGAGDAATPISTITSPFWVQMYGFKKGEY